MMKYLITYLFLSIFLLSCTRDVVIPKPKPEEIKPVIRKADLVGTWKLSGNNGGMGQGALKEVMFDENDSIKIRETDDTWCIDTSNWYATGTYSFVESDSTLNLNLFLQIKYCTDTTIYGTSSVPYKIVSHVLDTYIHPNRLEMLIKRLDTLNYTIANNPLMHPSNIGFCIKNK